MGKNNKRKTTDEFKNEVYKLTNTEYSILSEYVNCKTHVKFKHNKCGNIFEMSPDHFLRGYRCPKCSYKKLGLSRRHTTEEVKSLLETVGYKLLSEYSTSNEKLLVQSLDCGHTFKSVFRNIYTGFTGCPICNQSKGEKAIQDWLESHNFSFKSQYRFKECCDKRQLPFDFVVFIKDQMYLIEYNGIQHYSEDFRKGCTKKESLKDIQRRDLIKSEFCRKNNIPLLVIKYTDKENIPEILNNFLNSTTIENHIDE